MLHFGGGKFDKDNRAERSPYGPDNDTNNTRNNDMGEVYRTRKQELEERIAHKKLLKAERLKQKEDQLTTFENMDTSFNELASLLQFRDKEKERKDKFDRKKMGKLSADEMEMDAWDKEMKVRYLGKNPDNTSVHVLTFWFHFNILRLTHTYYCFLYAFYFIINRSFYSNVR